MFIQSFLRTETIFPNWLGIGREIGIVGHKCKWKMGAEVCVDMEELNSVGVQKNQ